MKPQDPERVAHGDVFEEDLGDYDACGVSNHRVNEDTGWFEHSEFIGPPHENWTPCAIINARIPYTRRLGS